MSAANRALRSTGEILDTYLCYLRGPPAYQAVESAIRRNLRPALGDVPAAALRRAHVVELMEGLARQGKRRLAGVCLAILPAALNRARRLEHLPPGADRTAGVRGLISAPGWQARPVTIPI